MGFSTQKQAYNRMGLPVQSVLGSCCNWMRGYKYAYETVAKLSLNLEETWQRTVS